MPTEVDDYVETFRAWAAHAAAADPDCRRFGVRHHRYRWRPVLPTARVAALEAMFGSELPAPYRRFITAIGDGGAGPYHGLLPLDHPIQHACARGDFAPTAADRELYRGVVGLGHIGCGQLALLVVGGPLAGQVWLDARACNAGVRALAPDFDRYYLSWVDAVARNQLPPGLVTAGGCPLPRALSHYLATVEARAGVAGGALSRAAVTAAFRALPIAAIRCEASGDDPFFGEGDPLDLCPACEVIVENLGGQGLVRDRLVSGESPLPARVSSVQADLSTH